MNRFAIGSALSDRLHAAEAAIDQALVDTAALAAALPVARLEAALAATAGQRAFDGAAAGLSALAAARGHLVDTHRALAAVARGLGLEILAVGQLDKPGDRPPVGGGVSAEDDPTRENMVTQRLENSPNKILPPGPPPC